MRGDFALRIQTAYRFGFAVIAGEDHKEICGRDKANADLTIHNLSSSVDEPLVGRAILLNEENESHFWGLDAGTGSL